MNTDGVCEDAWAFVSRILTIHWLRNFAVLALLVVTSLEGQFQPLKARVRDDLFVGCNLRVGSCVLELNRFLVE